MDFALSKEQEQLREDIRGFLESEIKAGSYEIMEDSWTMGFSREFSRKLAKKGWVGMTYPKELGGHGRSYVDRLIVSEELLRYGAPVRAHWIGDRQVGPCLLEFGTEEQKKSFLPDIINGETVFCLGFSEPDAGSDLASLKCQAIEQPDGTFLINGQKVWTSAAMVSDYIYLLARTDPKAPKKWQGISQFLVHSKLPGVTIRPIENVAGHLHYCEVFFDNARVEKDVLIGQAGSGWKQISRSLVFERSGAERIMSNYLVFKWLLEYVRNTELDSVPVKNKAWIRNKMAELTMKYEVGLNLIYRTAWLLDQIVYTNYIPNYETAMAKAFGVEFEQDLANVATKILGLYGLLAEGSKWVPIGGAATRSYLTSLGYGLQGGSTEILKGIVATAGLGLPRS